MSFLLTAVLKKMHEEIFLEITAFTLPISQARNKLITEQRLLQAIFSKELLFINALITVRHQSLSLILLRMKEVSPSYPFCPPPLSPQEGLMLRLPDGKLFRKTKKKLSEHGTKCREETIVSKVRMTFFPFTHKTSAPVCP